VACAGAVPVAVTDCLNYGDPEDPGVFWQFTEGVRGIGDACRSLGSSEDGDPLPVVSGNVSFYNQSETGEPISPSPIVACSGRVDDVSVCRGMGFKREGSIIALLGKLHSLMGGSEYAARFGLERDSGPPRPDLEREGVMQRTLVEGIRDGRILAAHDISHGGVLVTVAEMMLRSAPATIGCVLSVSDNFSIGSESAEPLFSEYAGIVIEVAAGEWDAFAALLEQRGVEAARIGQTAAADKMEIHLTDETVELTFSELAAACAGKCHQLFD
jgi:phosphoribosylformylglycinamidine synthase